MEMENLTSDGIEESPAFEPWRNTNSSLVYLVGIKGIKLKFFAARLGRGTSLAAAPEIDRPDADDVVALGEIVAVEQVDGWVAVGDHKLQDRPPGQEARHRRGRRPCRTRRRTSRRSSRNASLP